VHVFYGWFTEGFDTLDLTHCAISDGNHDWALTQVKPHFLAVVRHFALNLVRQAHRA